MPKHRSGGKFTSAHTTIIDVACVPIDAAAKLTAVSKIILGVIVQTRSKKPRMKCAETPTGLEMKIYSKISMQMFYIYTSDREATRATMFRVFKF